MKILNDEKIIQQTLIALDEQFTGDYYSETNRLDMQAVIEHALLTYTKEDIQAEAFLNPYFTGQYPDRLIQLFIEDTIFIELFIKTYKDEYGNERIDEFQALNVLQTNSL